MKSKSHGKKQCKIVKVLIVPFKILEKVSGWYLKCMEGRAGNLGGYGQFCPAPAQSMMVPRSFSVNSSKGSKDEDVRELVQVIAKRREMELNGKGRSYSVGVGKLGRIDEDEPCRFAGDLLFTKNKSCPVQRNYAYYS